MTKITVSAALEAVRTKKDSADDIVQSLVFNIWTDAATIGDLNTLYRKPIKLTIEELPQ